MKNYKIAVAGTGYVGLSIATLLSQHHQVTAVDIVPEKVEMINNRKSPIQDDYIEKYGNQVPIYVIPAMMYGTMNVKEVYQDALDSYDGYKKTHKNPMYFPGEDNNMKRKNRNVSYRRAYHITGEIEF